MEALPYGACRDVWGGRWLPFTKNAFEYMDYDSTFFLLARGDYDLGDIVPVISKRFGVANLARLTGLNIVEEQNANTKITLELSVEKMEVLK